MPSGDEYRAKAAELLALAQIQTDPRAMAARQALARSYLRLAEQADRNATADIVYEAPMDDMPSGEPIILNPAESTTPPLAKPDETPDSEIV